MKKARAKKDARRSSQERFKRLSEAQMVGDGVRGEGCGVKGGARTPKTQVDNALLN